MAGYAKKPLAEKLGIKPGRSAAFPSAPPEFAAALGALGEEVRVKKRATQPTDVVVAFFLRLAELDRRLPALSRAVYPAGGLWIAWPKRASGVPTDLDENVIRDRALRAGLVDNKVCAIDDTWSGLRLVHRRSARGGA